MSETQTENPELRREPTDPLGYLIIPVFILILVGVISLWLNQKNDIDKEEYFPVTGKVTVNKKPLEGTFQINFHPIDDANPVASGILEPDGTYELTSGSLGILGAKPGEYKVCVLMLEGSEESWRIQDPDPETIKINPKDGGTIVPPDPDPPFDKTCSSVKNTQLLAVVGEMENTFDIDLPLPSAAQLAAQKSREKKAKERKKAKENKPGKKEPGHQKATPQTSSQKTHP
ncbi:MAG: hypothetical protein VX438_06135 [Planctomycetota bacterium]|nr:hypothetical protein [Planctomycetota bacterium]